MLDTRDHRIVVSKESQPIRPVNFSAPQNFFLSPNYFFKPSLFS
jgi:hypothetical protein